MAIDTAPQRLLPIVAAFLRRHGFSKTLAALIREHGQAIEEETRSVDLETMHGLYMSLQDSGDLALCDLKEKYEKGLLACKQSSKRKGLKEDNGCLLLETAANEKAKKVKEVQNGCLEIEDTSEKKKKHKKQSIAVKDPTIVPAEHKEEKSSLEGEEIEEKCGRSKKKVASIEVNDTNSKPSNLEENISSKDNAYHIELQEPKFDVNGTHAPSKKPRKEKKKLKGALGGSRPKEPDVPKAGEEVNEEKGLAAEDVSVSKKRKKSTRKDESSAVMDQDKPTEVAHDAGASADDQSSKKSKKQKKEASAKSHEGGLQELSTKKPADAKPDKIDEPAGEANGKVEEKQRRKKTGDNAAIGKDSKEDELSTELTTTENERSGEDCKKYETSEKKKKQKDSKAKTPTGALAFKRVDLEKVDFHDARLKDNSYWAKLGAEEGYGAKAQEVLGQVRGRGFRHEKTKKKRGSYRGGAIDLQSHSIKFDNSDGE